MPIRSSVFTISACLNAALLVGCANGGSSVTHLAGTAPASSEQGTLAGAQGTPGGNVHSGVRRTLSEPTCSGLGLDAFIGGGSGNVAGGTHSVVAGGGENEACAGYSAIVGGYENAVGGGAYEGSFIGGGENNVVIGGNNQSAIVAGGNNSVDDSFALVGGGQSNGIGAGGTYGAIAGGNQNSVSGAYGFLGGGSTNTVSAEYGVIGGGLDNTVSGEGGYIAAGGYNTVSGEGAVIDGGFNSTAAGTFATIPGGYVNSAAGTYSFAAGARASAAQTGTFVWSDGSNGDTILTSTAAYQFLARASGGYALWTNAAATVGATLAPGSGTWASASDRNLKTDVARLDDAAVLAKVAELPISRWSYKSERGVQHVGPMAQDFYAAFKVGEGDKHITSIDEDGVALAAIKALRTENAELRAQVHRERQERRTVTHSQSAEIAALRTEVESIRAEIRSKR